MGKMSDVCFVQALLLLASATVTWSCFSVPGTTFDDHFCDERGYINLTINATTLDGTSVSVDVNMFFWLAHYEYDDNSTTVPVIWWFDGGPGCSSIARVFSGCGPYFVNRNGETVFENQYSWTKIGHLIAMDTPPGTGFSTANRDDIIWDDKTVARLNAHAVHGFMRYHGWLEGSDGNSGNPFYAVGESYAGVYIPTMLDEMQRLIQEHELPRLNLHGMAIGNGFLDAKALFASLIPLFRARGYMPEDEYKDICDACCDGKPVTRWCSGIQDAISFDDEGNVVHNDSACGQLIRPWLNSSDPHARINPMRTNIYDPYTVCYEDTKYFLELKNDPNCSRDSLQGCLNYASTDPWDGFPCWKIDAVSDYLNKYSDAKHINTLKDFCWCCNITYKVTPQHDMLQSVYNVLNSPIYRHNVRLLLYNGDVDFVCNFLGDNWFAHRLLDKLNETSYVAGNVIQTHKHSSWVYKEKDAGSWESYTLVDVLTVLGAGHSAQEDRPPQVFQMLFNFVNSSMTMKANYSRPVEDINFAPLARKGATSATVNISLLIFALFLALRT